MNIFPLSIAIAILFLIETTLFPLPLVFIYLLLYLIFISEKDALWVGFFVGVVFDLVYLRPLGFTSAMFVSLLWIVSLYKKKFSTFSYLYIGIATFLTTLVILFFNTQVWYSWRAVVCAGIAVVITKLLFTGRNTYHTIQTWM